MQLRDHEAVSTKRDFFMVDPRSLKVEDGYNVRDLSTPDAIIKLEELRDSIIANSVRVPLEVRLDGEDIYVLAGHRRLAAVMMAIAMGEDIKAIPVVPEPKYRNRELRTLDLIVSNTGEPLTPLEKAKVVGRLVGYGWSHADIAKRCGWKSTASVLQHLEMLELPEAVKEEVRNGTVSASLAKKISKNCDPELAAKLIKDNAEENKRIKGTKRARVTEKTMRRDRPHINKGGHNPETSQVTERPGPPPPSNVPKPQAQSPIRAPEAIHDPSPPNASGGFTLPDFKNTEMSAAVSLPSGLPATPETESPQAPRSPSIHGSVAILVEAIRPFAKVVDDIDPDCANDTDIFISDHVGNINAGTLRAAWRALQAVTGGVDG